MPQEINRPRRPVIPNVGRDSIMIRKDIAREISRPDQKYNLSEWHHKDLKKDPDVYHSFVPKQG